MKKAGTGDNGHPGGSMKAFIEDFERHGGGNKEFELIETPFLPKQGRYFVGVIHLDTRDHAHLVANEYPNGEYKPENPVSEPTVIIPKFPGGMAQSYCMYDKAFQENLVKIAKKWKYNKTQIQEMLKLVAEWDDGGQNNPLIVLKRVAAIEYLEETGMVASDIEFVGGVKRYGQKGRSNHFQTNFFLEAKKVYAPNGQGLKAIEVLEESYKPSMWDDEVVQTCVPREVAQLSDLKAHVHRIAAGQYFMQRLQKDQDFGMRNFNLAGIFENIALSRSKTK